MKRILIILLTIKKQAGATLSIVSCSLLTILCSLLTIHCSAKLHGQAKIDSLLKELPRQKEDTNKVNILNDISYGYRHIDSDEGIKYGRQALELATKLTWRKGIAGASSELGHNYDAQAEYPKALECFSKSLKISEEIGDKNGIATAACNIGIVYDSQSDYPKALENYLRALNILEEIGTKKGVAIVTGNIGNVYANQSDYPKALEFYFKALMISEEIGDKRGIASNVGNIGSIYCLENEYPKALEYFIRALKADEEIGAKAGIAMHSGNIGSVFLKKGDYPKALEYYLKSLKISEEIGDKIGIGRVAGNIGTVYSEQYNYTQAVAWHFKALRIVEAIGARNSEAHALCNIGSDYISIVADPVGTDNITKALELQSAPYHSANLPSGQPGLIPKGRLALLQNAKKYLNKAVAINKEIENLYQLRACYKFLSSADSLLGDYKGALEARDNYHAIKDSLFSQENKEEILKMSMKSDYDCQRLTDSLKVAEEQKIARINLQKQKSYTYAGIAGILLLGGFSFFVFKERRKSEAERKKSDGLLLNILPETVAEELKAKGITSARHYDDVTVLFTDFVNFTQASESMSPQALIDELHTCFKKFDEISEKYRIEKIKTIGDAYLAVAGLPTDDPEHALHVVSAAKEITAFMADRLAKLGSERTFEVRVGIHSGSVVAGVVGVKKFAYDIWGDTVNTAARMEQNSEAGKINISQTTYELVKDKFTCEYRGEVEVKGKGVMKMYYIS